MDEQTRRNEATRQMQIKIATYTIASKKVSESRREEARQHLARLTAK